MSTEGGAFQLLHPAVQRWIWGRRWTSLRPVQELAVAPVLAATEDIVLAAPTAGGKTEAAFLPILSRLLAEDPGGSFRVLYVAPLRALINDQHERLTGICDPMGIAVHRWHGDVPGSHKQRARMDPSGLLLITPESLEALFVLRGAELTRLFAGLTYVVVDELHAFIATERGRQLQSQLDRLEAVLLRSVPRIGLSATIGDLRLAAEHLRPGGGDAVEIIAPAAEGAEVRLQIRGYRMGAAASADDTDAADGAEAPGPPDARDDGVEAIASDLIRVIGQGHHLVFCNSRGMVERTVDVLGRAAEAVRSPVELLPHHGSLSRQVREDAERRMKEGGRPASVVCTVTLELGIDLGEVDSIAQVGSLYSVASTRQRLGRSGRRGSPATLRVYVPEEERERARNLGDHLRADLVQAIAVLQLLLAGWCEPPIAGDLHLSTLVQQTLSLIAERGGVSAPTAHRALAVEGPFREVTPERYGALLTALGAADLIRQEPSGRLLLAQTGERIVGHYEFYAAFAGSDEYEVVGDGRPLGTLLPTSDLAIGEPLLFAGRRWTIVDVDDQRRRITVTAARDGREPHFASGRPRVHDRVREEMRAVYLGTDVPAFLDPVARELLAEGRAAFTERGLVNNVVITEQGITSILPWAGDRTLLTLARWLTTLGVRAEPAGVAITVVGAEGAEVLRALATIAAGPPIDPHLLADGVPQKAVAKWDWTLPPDLLAAAWAGRELDVPAAHALAKRLLGGGGGVTTLPAHTD